MAPQPSGFLEALELAINTEPITATKATNNNIKRMFSTDSVTSVLPEYVLKI